MPNKTCQICGKSFDDGWHKEQIFCSRICWYIHDHQARQPNPADFVCENCGKPFQKFPGSANMKAKHNFCSRECDNKWRAKGGNPSGKTHPEYNSVTVNCAYCGNEIIREPYRLRTNPLQFCNMKCHGKWRSEHLHGEAHPRWRGGSLPDYGPEWNRIAEAIRKRDGYKCQYCGVSQKWYGRKLHVHHIIPFRNFGYKRGENENHLLAHASENLVSLCNSCHIQFEAGHIQLSA